jgi:hypothetical protein
VDIWFTISSKTNTKFSLKGNMSARMKPFAHTRSPTCRVCAMEWRDDHEWMHTHELGGRHNQSSADITRGTFSTTAGRRRQENCLLKRLKQQFETQNLNSVSIPRVGMNTGTFHQCKRRESHSYSS